MSQPSMYSLYTLLHAEMAAPDMKPHTSRLQRNDLTALGPCISKTLPVGSGAFRAAHPQT